MTNLKTLEAKPLMVKPFKRTTNASKSTARYLLKNRSDFGRKVQEDLDQLIQDTEELDREIWNTVKAARDQVYAMVNAVNTAVEQNGVRTQGLSKAWDRVQKSSRALATDAKAITQKARKSAK